MLGIILTTVERPAQTTVMRRALPHTLDERSWETD